MTDDFPPSVFTPFLRTFTNERARDTEETRRLYERVRELHLRSSYGRADAILDVGGAIYSTCPDLSDTVRSAIARAIDATLRMEQHIFRFPQVDLAHLSLSEAVGLRQYLRAKEHFHAHEAKTIGILEEALSRIFGTIAHMLPDAEVTSPFTIPLALSLPEPKKFMGQLIHELWKEKYIEAGLFIDLARPVYLNLCRASGIIDPNEPQRPFVFPTEYDGTVQDAVETYFNGTTFYDLFMAPVPLRFTYQERYSHMHVLGGSGAGKTTLLQNLILDDLQSDNPPSLVIIDSQGDLISKLSKLALFDPDNGPLADRLVLISPKDIDHPPALNIFALNRDRLGQYDEATKEQVTAGVIQTFDYLFAGLLGADLTAKQGVFFRFVARLMLSLPETLGRNATILDMIALMDDVGPYKKAIERLPPIQRNFFERDFASKTFAQTREQIRYRLNAILENPTLARLFTAPDTKIDLFDVLNNGGIVLVDTAKDFLKGSSAHFGRIFISLVLQAILERAVIPERLRRPTFLIVDEAAAYFDSNIDDFLTEARKYKCGCVFAHQFLDQATYSLRASLAANTSIKMAGGVSMSDARSLAPDMRTTHEFILGQPKLHFACHIRNVTPSAVSIPVPVGVLERQPALSENAYERLREINRYRVSLAKDTKAEGPSNLGPSEAERSPPEGDPSAPSEEW